MDSNWGGKANAGRTVRALAAGAIGLGLALTIVLALSAPAPAAEPFSGGAVHTSGEATGAVLRAQTIDRNLTLVRIAVAALALATVVALRRRRPAGRPGGVGLLAFLGVLALLAFVNNYNFFKWTHVGGIHTHDAFHYYLGSKYFEELGYYGLYECVVLASTEGRPELAARRYEIRDLHEIDRRKYVVPAEHAPRCDGAFTPERWRAFRHDAQLLRNRMIPAESERVIVDQGLNASPVWLLIGSPITARVPAEPGPLRLLARIDLLLLVVAFSAIGWAFGWPAMFFAIVVWGTNPLSRYQWIGDSVLRQLWLTTMLVGIAALKRGHAASAGVALAASGLLRLFPLAVPGTYAVYALRRFARTRTFDARFLRFCTAASAASLLLLAAAVPVLGRGVDVYREFGDNISKHRLLTARNSTGLRPLLSYSSRMANPYLVDGEYRITDRSVRERDEAVFSERRWLYLGGVALCLGLLWRALGREDLEPWEAAALGSCLVMIVASPASYYTSCFVALALLATKRPRMQPIFLVTMILLSWLQIEYLSSRLQYVWSSALLLALILYVLVDVAFLPATAATAPASPIPPEPDDARQER